MCSIFNLWIALAFYSLATLWMYNYQRDGEATKSVKLFVSFLWPIIWFVAIARLIVNRRA